MNLIARNFSANLLSNVWLTVLSLLLTPLYIAFLGIESFGLIAFYMSWVAILSILDMSFSIAATREIAWRSAKSETKTTLPVLIKSLEVTYWTIIIFVGIFILIAAWLIGADWFETTDLSPEFIRNVLVLMSISLIVQVPSGLYIGGLIGLQRQVECAGLTAFFSTVRGCVAILLLWLINNDLYTFFIWQIVISLIQTGVLRWALWRRIDTSINPVRFSLKMTLTIKNYVGSVMLIGIFGVILSQADKLILSGRVSLENFGFYMVAWTVASGFSRAATPLLHAFQPKFTELIALGDEGELAKHLWLASQIMSVLIMPPAAMLVFLSEPILTIWTGNDSVSATTAPILSIMIFGTLFSSCSYPSVSILYCRDQLLTVVATGVICVIILVPLLFVAIEHFEAVGAALVWAIYGIILYLSYQFFGLRSFKDVNLLSSTLKNFITPLVMAFLTASVLCYGLRFVTEPILFTSLVILSLFVVWCVTALSCGALRAIIMRKIKCKI